MLFRSDLFVPRNVQALPDRVAGLGGIDPYIAAGHAQLDDVIDPAETRHAIWKGLHVSRAKQIDRPWRKHGVLPV